MENLLFFECPMCCNVFETDFDEQELVSKEEKIDLYCPFCELITCQLVLKPKKSQEQLLKELGY